MIPGKIVLVIDRHNAVDGNGKPGVSLSGRFYYKGAAVELSTDDRDVVSLKHYRFAHEATEAELTKYREAIAALNAQSQETGTGTDPGGNPSDPPPAANPAAKTKGK